jgi:cytochrome c556
MIKKQILKPAFIILLSFQLSTHSGSGQAEEEPLMLRQIMRDMGTDMQVIVDAISRENWKTVETSALKIATHPQPPFTEKLRILSFVGFDVNQYKKYDGNTHDIAKQLSQTANEKDSYGVTSAFYDLQNACLACHQHFRKQFIDHFYSPD